MRRFEIEADPGQPTPALSACDADDRRSEPRYAPVMDRAFLGWWERDAFRTAVGRLANISSGGAALELAAEPATDDGVWLCVVGPHRSAWVAARVLGRRGPVFRMVFAERFPYELFKSVVWGLPAEETPAPEAGIEDESRVVDHVATA
jgi:hypothetical protein